MGLSTSSSAVLFRRRGACPAGRRTYATFTRTPGPFAALQTTSVPGLRQLQLHHAPVHLLHLSGCGTAQRGSSVWPCLHRELTLRFGANSRASRGRRGDRTRTTAHHLPASCSAAVPAATAPSLSLAPAPRRQSPLAGCSAFGSRGRGAFRAGAGKALLPSSMPEGEGAAEREPLLLKTYSAPTAGTSPLSAKECQEFPSAGAGILEQSTSQTLLSLLLCSALPRSASQDETSQGRPRQRRGRLAGPRASRLLNSVLQTPSTRNCSPAHSPGGADCAPRREAHSNTVLPNF